MTLSLQHNGAVCNDSGGLRRSPQRPSSKQIVCSYNCLSVQANIQGLGPRVSPILDFYSVKIQLVSPNPVGLGAVLWVKELECM